MRLLRRDTAVKLLVPELSDPASVARFEREVCLTCRLMHPNTIQVYDYGHTPEGIFYYAMEYLHRREPARSGGAVRAAAGGARGVYPGANLRFARGGPRAGADPPRHQARQHLSVPARRRGRIA